MNVRKTTLLLAGLLVAWRAGAQGTQSQEQTTSTAGRGSPAAPSAQASGQEKTVTGTLAAVSKNEITVETSAASARSPTTTMKLKLSDSTQVSDAGRERSVADLQQGAQIRAAYDERGSDRTATRIDVIAPAETTPPDASTGAGSPSGSAEAGDGTPGSGSGGGDTEPTARPKTK